MATDKTSCPTFRVVGNSEIRATGKTELGEESLDPTPSWITGVALVSLPIIHARMMAHIKANHRLGKK
jgi:hypothetical protein